MRVLVACERSGVVRDAFRALGHDAWSCDLLPSESETEAGYHLEGDARIWLSNEQIAQWQWDLMIAHPPCTYLSVSGLHWNKRRPERAAKTEEALAFVRFLLDAPISRIAIENPISCISTRIRKPDQVIQPYQFGHDASKSTCLWLKNLPPLTPTCYVEPRMVCECGTVYSYAMAKGCHLCGREQAFAKPRWANQTDSGQNRLAPSPTRSAERARTYEGIAAAMAEQWGRLDP